MLLYVSSSSSLVLELQQQVATLLAEKQQVEADRQEMAIKQGNYKGTIAQVIELQLQQQLNSSIQYNAAAAPTREGRTAPQQWTDTAAWDASKWLEQLGTVHAPRLDQ
jgi:hypothetical protein